MAHYHNYSVFKNFCVQFNVSSQNMLQRTRTCMCVVDNGSGNSMGDYTRTCT